MTNPLPPVFSKPIASNRCHSLTRLVKVDFQWTIQDFGIDFYRKCKIPKLVSSAFSTNLLPSLKWKIQLEQINYTYSSSIPFTLSYNCSDKAAVCRAMPFRVKYGILNKKGKTIFSTEQCDSIKNSENSYSLIISISHGNFNSSPEYINSLSDEGHLTFIFEIGVFLSETILSGETLKNESFSSNNELSNHMAKIWETKEFSDVTFNVNGTAFQAHKVILSARSPVFAAMFEQPMKEKLTNQVVVTDVDSAVFEQVLRFIYTGQVTANQMNRLASRLLAAAEKYMLENLKKECEKHLANKLSAENCCDFLMLASIHSAKNLEQNALNFFRLYPAQVLASDNWSSLAQNKDLLAWLCETIKDVFRISVDAS